MKNKFITKKRKRKTLFIIIMISIGITLSYKKLEKSKIKISNKEFINIIRDNTFEHNNNNNLLKDIVNINNPIKLMSKNYGEYTKSKVEKVTKEETSPIIYLYNSHQTEEYASSSFIEFSVNPTVIMNNYILEDVFNKNGYKTIVEERSISDVIRQNNWNYANSYKASRIFLEEVIKSYPTLKYFIDIHRDSLKKDKTTITIDNKDYAKVIFLIGLENPNYEKNLEFTEKINNKLDELYPNLSKGIYKKGGAGVNGVYNQDFSEYTILIEIGGEENTTNEVLNTSLAFSKAFMEVINE